MNRRSYLKSLFFLGTAAIASLSIFKWIVIYRPVDPKEFWAKREILAELAELIIPMTDTPGAKAAGVQDYIINVMIHCNPVKQQRRFISGLEDLEKYAIENYRKEFINCNLEDRLALLSYFEKKSFYSFKILNKVDNKLFNEPFYIKLRNLTVEGYCQSKLGATIGLAYDYIPGKFEPCIPLVKHQKSWATK